MIRILLVDDSLDELVILEKGCKRIGFEVEVHWLPSFEMARSLVVYRRDFDLILVDMIGTGLGVVPAETLKQLKFSPVWMTSSSVIPQTHDYFFVLKDKLPLTILEYFREKGKHGSGQSKIQNIV